MSQVFARFCAAGTDLTAAVNATAKPVGAESSAISPAANWTEWPRHRAPPDSSSAVRFRARRTVRASTAVASATPSTRALLVKPVSLFSAAFSVSHVEIPPRLLFPVIYTAHHLYRWMARLCRQETNSCPFSLSIRSIFSIFSLK